MRFAAVQHDIAWMDKGANWATVRRLLASANLPRGSFALLPELGDTGFAMDAHAARGGDSLALASAAAGDLGLWLQAGYADLAAGAPLPGNAAAVVAPDGSVHGSYRKVHLFSPGSETQHYRSGDSIAIIEVASAQGNWKVCPLICYDLRYPEVFRLAALAGAEVFTVGASWPSARAAHWRALAIARAIENQAYVVACNRIGHDPHSTYEGGSIIVAPSGEVIADAHYREEVISALLDRAELLRWRDRFPALRDIRRSLLGSIEVRDARS